MQFPGWKILKNFIVTTMENEMYVYTELQSLGILDDSKQMIMKMKWHAK
jgi:hypothetical protein